MSRDGLDVLSYRLPGAFILRWITGDKAAVRSQLKPQDFGPVNSKADGLLWHFLTVSNAQDRHYFQRSVPSQPSSQLRHREQRCFDIGTKDWYPIRTDVHLKLLNISSRRNLRPSPKHPFQDLARRHNQASCRQKQRATKLSTLHD